MHPVCWYKIMEGKDDKGGLGIKGGARVCVYCMRELILFTEFKVRIQWQVNETMVIIIHVLLEVISFVAKKLHVQ
jgi:hypothetical protein